MAEDDVSSPSPIPASTGPGAPPDYSQLVNQLIWQPPAATQPATQQLANMVTQMPVTQPSIMSLPMIQMMGSPALRGAPTSGGAGGGGGGAPAGPIAGAGLRGRTPLPQGWESQILQALGAPVNPQTIGDLDLWQRYEGGSTLNAASYNPLDTTLREPGSSAMNSVGVQAFPNWQEGLAATVSTLKQNNMAGILRALQSGGGGFSSAVNASPWGSHLP
jgi:hypothetical protein